MKTTFAPDSTLPDLVRQIRLLHPAGFCLNLIFERCAIAVYCDQEAMRDYLAEYFRPFVSEASKNPALFISVHQAEAQFPFALTVKQPDPGKSKVKEEYADLPGGRLVRKRLTGMQFLFGENDHLAIGPCRENPNQVVNFINNRFIEWKLRRGSLLGHAAAVLHNSRGLALAGFSGMGKSTLALHLLSQGTQFVSNDRLLVEAEEAGCRMSGVAKLPRVNPGTVLHNPDLSGVIPDADRCRFHALPSEELWDLEHKFDVDIDSCFGPEKFTLTAPLHGLALLNWQRGGGPMIVSQVDLRRRRDLLPAFIKSPGLFYLGQGDEGERFSEEHYLDLLGRLTVYEFAGGADFARAADRCLDFLHGSG